MAVPVVGIGVVCMAVVQGFMAVTMGMLPFERRHMRMRMVAVRVRMRMQVLVFQRLMQVRVRVVFSQVQPDAERHQEPGHQQRPGDGFRQKEH
jgi:uncharacterized membrane protein